MNCVFSVTQLDDGRYRHDCPVCNVPVITASKRYIRVCWPNGVERPERPSFGKLLVNFSRDAIAHFVNGSPTCTEEQINGRIEICHACELFRVDKDNPDVGICTHEKCGCNMGREQKFLNAVAWADKECPLKKWTAIINTQE